MPINILFYIFIFIAFTSNVNADICNKGIDPRSQKEWIISNICHFDNTVLVEIKSDYLYEWYNPLTHFSAPNVFIYEVEIIEVFSGTNPETSCMLESTESTFVITAGISNTRQIVSFNEIGECVFIDVAARQHSTIELESYARSIAKEIEGGK